MPESFTRKWLILCEGKSDIAVLSNLIESRGLSSFQISEVEGKDRLCTHLRAISTNEEFIKHVKAILIIFDNDEEPRKSFQYIQDQIQKAGRTPPPKPLQATNDEVPIVVLMMPWTDKQGTLETLCIEACYSKWKGIKGSLDAFVVGTPAKDWGSSKQAKMRMQCVIAATCKQDPNTPLRYLFSRHKQYHFSTKHRCFNQLADFLKNFGKTASP